MGMAPLWVAKDLCDDWQHRRVIDEVTVRLAPESHPVVRVAVAVGARLSRLHLGLMPLAWVERAVIGVIRSVELCQLVR